MKKLLRIILPQVGKAGLIKYIFLAILSGFCSFLFMNTVTRVIGLIVAGGFTNVSREYLLIFAGIIVGFIWVRRTLALAIIKLSQHLFWRLRMDIVSLVLNANYQQLASRREQIHSAIVSDVTVLTNVSMTTIDFFAALIMSCSCLVYLCSISWVLFLITLGVALTGVAVYRLNSRSNMKDFNRARYLENNFQENFNAILNGFKEIYMEPKKGKSIFDNNIREIAKEAYGNNTTAFTGFLNNQITGQILFYMLISAVLLFFSVILHIKAQDTISFVFALLYLLSAIETLMVLLPGIMRAGIASRHLMQLKSELEEANFNNPLPEKYFTRKDFEQVSVKGIAFKYGKNEQAFGIGPIDFDMEKGKVIFVYGGNGSGKTTFIYTVLGLCFPSAGEIRLNDILVDGDNYATYRTLFSVVFNDFYLFNQLVGLDHIDMDRWDNYIRLFELQGKVKLEGNKLSTTDLSTGQRKRLALIISLLEDKPVLVLDEWAADQDPYFRKKFYTEIIPLLKNEGLTIIGITHDDKYYYCADSLYKMEEGKLIREDIRLHHPGLLDAVS